MALLTNSQKTKIRRAINLVTDQFMVTPVNYHMSGKNFDRFNEGGGDKLFYSIRLSALVEYNTNDNIVTALQGNTDNQEIKLTFNLEDLQKLNLITSDYKVKFNQTKDYFTIKSQLYKVVDIYYDGPLDEKDVLVIIKGELSKNSDLNFNTFIDKGSQKPVEEVVPDEIWNEGDTPSW